MYQAREQMYVITNNSQWLPRRSPLEPIILAAHKKQDSCVDIRLIHLMNTRTCTEPSKRVSIVVVDVLDMILQIFSILKLHTVINYLKHVLNKPLFKWLSFAEYLTYVVRSVFFFKFSIKSTFSTCIRVCCFLLTKGCITNKYSKRLAIEHFGLWFNWYSPAMA